VVRAILEHEGRTILRTIAITAVLLASTSPAESVQEFSGDEHWEPALCPRLLSSSPDEMEEYMLLWSLSAGMSADQDRRSWF
jgi:hypothetical protein